MGYWIEDGVLITESSGKFKCLAVRTKSRWEKMAKPFGVIVEGAPKDESRISEAEAKMVLFESEEISTNREAGYFYFPYIPLVVGELKTPK